MSDPSDKYALPRLVLEYLRAFAWPLVVVVVLLAYGEELIGLVETREFQAFGVSFGPRIAEVQERVEAELADINELVERQRGAPESEREQINKDLTAKIQSLERSVDREVGEIRALEASAATRPASPPTTPTAESEAKRLERRGFDALIAGDARGALEAIDSAYERWPEYHNLAEVRKLLRDNRGELGEPDSEAWKAVYRKILTDYSWGLSQEHRAALREKLY